jgi:hypothetical protein
MLLDRRRGNPKEIASTTQAPRSILPGHIPLEFQVLLSACRVFLGTEEPSSLVATLAQGPDWDRLLRLANRHGVMPLLYRSISKNCPQAVPQEWLRRLMLQYMQNAARNMKMTGELLRIIDLFKANGIAAIPFKGPALAEQIYGDVTLRSYVDLDILVRKEDVLRAKEVMLQEGYIPEFYMDHGQENVLLKYDCEYNFEHKARGVHIEFHWRLTRSSYNLDFDWKSIWFRTEIISFEGRHILALSTEDLLMALCVHGAKHCWLDNSLKLICDVAGLIDISKNLDWESVLVNARKYRAERILLLGLMLAKVATEVKLPEHISKDLKDDQVLNAMTSNILMHLFADSKRSPAYWERFIFWSQVRECHLDSMLGIFRLALQPTKNDFKLVSLPVQLHPLYYLIHSASRIWNKMKIY